MSHSMKPAAESTKIGKRKGTRSVSTLTPAQLARKRANDREAQRAIRARTKEHIENLEREIEELRSQHGRDQTIQTLLRRNKALEDELRQLRGSMGLPNTDASDPYQPIFPGSSPPRSSSFGQAATHYPIMQNMSSYNNVHDAADSWAPAMACSISSPASSPSSSGTTEDFGSNYIHSTPSTVFERSSLPPTTHSPTISCDRGDGNFDNMKPDPYRVWMPATQHRAYQPNLSFPTVEYVSHAIPNVSTNRARPGTSDAPDWEVPVLTTQSSCRNDALLVAYIEDCRRLVNMAGGRPHPAVTLGSTRPNVRPLLENHAEVLAALGLHQKAQRPGSSLPPGPEPQSSHPLMDLAATLFDWDHLVGALERVGSFLLLQGLLGWLIQPTRETYMGLGAIFPPQPSQRMMPHHQWIDLLLWAPLRDAVIRLQDIYATAEFRQVYNTNLRLRNWSSGITGALFTDHSAGAIYIKKEFEQHIWRLENWTLDQDFARRYPELEGLVSISRPH
ncbi:hypothetical protein F4677DRAFT_238381 [Hypoxylon crocopeplum]|nr:hypothetical protein F4677DRAFT_238381 [Hypoxylon crocopeplum]